MPDIVQQGLSSYPGIPGFEAVVYSVQHGKTPGRIIATTRFPPNAAPLYGTFTMTDGLNALVIGDCKFQRAETEIGEGGYLFTAYFLDRAWRWGYGKISGHYNQRDTRGNLKPRTVKTFKEMMEILLKKMGEKRWVIDAPDGIKQDQLDVTNDNPAPGQTTPPTNTNPEVFWDHRVPVDALADLCDLAGRRFMRCPIRDIVIISRPGDGKPLPYTPQFIDVTDGLDGTATPDGIGIVGATAMFQMRLRLIPVGLEWDGRYVPIDELSYRPGRTPSPGKWTITLASSGAGPYTLVSTVGGVSFGAMVEASVADLATRLAAAINADPSLQSRVTAEVTGGVITITGRKVGDGVDVASAIDGSNATAVVKTETPATKSAWDQEVPGHWYGVRATDRLSYTQAQQLAIDGVYRCFRVADDDVSNGWGGPAGGAPKKIFVPYFGEIKHRDQLVILTEKVEQVKPEKPNPNVVSGSGPDAGLPAQQVDTYFGYSAGQSPAVYGAICNLCVGRWYHNTAGKNTPAGSRVAPPFVVDPVGQIVTFTSGPVYKQVNDTAPGDAPLFVAPNLVLETAVNVLENDTYGPLRYLRWMNFGKPKSDASEDRDRTVEIDLSKYGIKNTPVVKAKLPKRRENIGTDDVPKDATQWYRHETDVQYAAIGEYKYDAATDKHTLVSSKTDPDDISAKVADYYLIGHVLEHQVEDAQTARYRGVELIELDGAIQQVSWAIGGGGTMTTASRNQSHGVNVLPYPARRREENLAADPERAALNARQNLIPAIAGGITAGVSKLVNSVTNLFKG